MKPGTLCIEVTVACTLARYRTLSPFHWAVLRALELFPPGTRPGFDELAARLRIGERLFLEEAWKDVARWRATDDDAFAVARVSVSGSEALRSGWFVLGEPTVRRHTLYFAKDDGAPLTTNRFSLTTVRDVRRPPGWGGTLTPARVQEALALQKPNERVRPGERVTAIDAEWESAQEVRVIPA